jgi:hypothetical protein
VESIDHRGSRARQTGRQDGEVRPGTGDDANCDPRQLAAGMTGELLPWERPDGDPSGTGICLSGGGLRAASFSMGVLQELQDRRGMLFGPQAVDHLAAVSGGSYISAAAMLNAHAAAASPSPLAEGSPEADHIVSHGRYLVEDGWAAAYPFVWRLVVSLVAAGLLVTWTGFMLADFGVIVERWLPGLRFDGTVAWLAGLGSFVAIGVLGAGLHSDRLVVQYLRPLIGLPALVLTAPSLIGLVRRTDWLRGPSWWWGHPLLVTPVIVVYLAASAISFRFPKARGQADGLVRGLQRAALALISCFSIARLEPHVSRIFEEQPSATDAIVIVVALLGGLWASYVHDTVSLHRPYRDLASRCFAVRRDGTTVERVMPPTIARLSDLTPPAEPTRRHPRVLICATANLHGVRAAAPFVFSHDRSGLCGVPDASFTTAKLELGRMRRSPFTLAKEPELSLMGAVAMTGAALSPSMGRMTSVGLRPVLTALNGRLGVWMPNPLSPSRRRVVELRPGKLPLGSPHVQEHGWLGAGFSAVLGELLGAHSTNAKRLYITDGGHYDNLGLTTLLRARCAEIWCVDAYAGGGHLGKQLAGVLALAQEELGVQVDIDIDRFARVAGSDGLATSCVAIGTIHYPGSATAGRLIVIKSALTPHTPQELVGYRAIDPKFPYHSTFVQWFGTDRFDHYRRLGRSAAAEAVVAAAT